MAEERSVKWILIISLVMIGVTWYSGSIIYGPSYYTQRAWTIFDHIAYWVRPIDTLLFIATITTSTLSTTGFKKDLLYKVSVYLFTASMILLFVNLLSRLFSF